MRVHGPLRDDQVVGNLTIRQTTSNKSRYFELAWTQRAIGGRASAWLGVFNRPIGSKREVE